LSGSRLTVPNLITAARILKVPTKRMYWQERPDAARDEETPVETETAAAKPEAKAEAPSSESADAAAPVPLHTQIFQALVEEEPAPAPKPKRRAKPAAPPPPEARPQPESPKPPAPAAEETQKPAPRKPVAAKPEPEPTRPAARDTKAATASRNMPQPGGPAASGGKDKGASESPLLSRIEKALDSDESREAAMAPPPKPAPAARPKSPKPAKSAAPPADKAAAKKTQVAALPKSRAPLRRLPPPKAADAGSLMLGINTKLGKPLDRKLLMSRSCVEKTANGIWYCMEPIAWPDGVKSIFATRISLFPGHLSVVRYDKGVSTQVHTLFPTEYFEHVVKHFEGRFGGPSEVKENWTHQIGRPALPNPTFRWRGMDASGGRPVILELRRYDDLRSVLPDIKVGVARLYREGLPSVFQHLSVADIMLIKFVE